MAGKSFFEVLESQIRAEIREELRAELETEIRAKLTDGDSQGRSDQGAATHPTSSSALIEGAAGRLETWLASHVEKSQFSRATQGRRAYGANPRRSTSRAVARISTQDHRGQGAPQDQRAPGNPEDHQNRISQQFQMEFRFEARAIEDLCRLELLRRQGAELGDSFTAQELKSAWRQVALKTHPDRFSQADTLTQRRMAELFREITEAYGELAARIEQATLAA